jgi:hypothetical protein
LGTKIVALRIQLATATKILSFALAHGIVQKGGMRDSIDFHLNNFKTSKNQLQKMYFSLTRPNPF